MGKLTEPKLGKGRVPENFFKSRGKTSVAIKAGNILSNNNQFLLLKTNLNCLLEGFIRSLVSDNNFQKFHFWNRGEIMHTNNIFWSGMGFSDFTDEETGSIGGENGVWLGNSFNFFDNLNFRVGVGSFLGRGQGHFGVLGTYAVFQVKNFWNSFDNDIRIGDFRIVKGWGKSLSDDVSIPLGKFSSLYTFGQGCLNTLGTIVQPWEGCILQNNLFSSLLERTIKSDGKCNI